MVHECIHAAIQLPTSELGSLVWGLNRRHILPFLGGIARMGTAILAAVIAAPTAFITIAIAWVLYHPILGISLLVLAVAIPVALVALKKEVAGSSLRLYFPLAKRRLELGNEGMRGTPPSPRSARDAKTVALWFWGIVSVFFLSAFLLYSQPSDFPWFYHFDEATKAEQIAENTRNLHHPLLMLELSQIVYAIRGGDDVQAAAEAGRLVVATAAAGCVVMACCLGWLMVGPVGAILCGLAVLGCPQLYLLAHFTKEDPVLACFWLTVFVLFSMIAVRRDHATLIALGMACGLAASAKYAGWLLLPAGMLLTGGTGWRPDATRVRRILILTGAALGVFILFNIRMLTGAELAVHRIIEEVTHLSKGHDGISTYSSPYFYANVFSWQNGMTWCLPALGGMICLLRQPAKRRPVLAAIAVLSIYSVLILLSRKQAEPYYLILNISLHVAAGIGIAFFLRRVSKLPGRWWIAPAIVISVVPFAYDWLAMAKVWGSFQHQSQAALREFVELTLPKDARILEDWRVNLSRDLPNASRRLYAGEIGSIQAARDAGFQYVAVAWPDYYRFLRMDSVIRKPLDAGGFEKIRHFYQSLPAECRLIWHAEPDANMYFHPGLSLYDITRPPRGG